MFAILFLVLATLLWALFFYYHCWTASIPAFGDTAQYLATLRRVFWGYLLVGLSLGVGWWRWWWHRRLAKAARRSSSELRQKDH